MPNKRQLPKWSVIRNRLTLIIIALVFMSGFPNDTPAENSVEDRVVGESRNVLFNYVGWEADALMQKWLQKESGLAPYMTDAERSAYVVHYLQVVGNFQNVDSQISLIYSDPNVSDPDAKSATLKQQRADLQSQLDQQQPLAESIIESQVASVLRDEGLATFGEVMPPVSAHISTLPMMLVVSPRNEIRFAVGVTVTNMPIDQRIMLENQVDHDVNVSSLLVALGGLSLYPSMVIQVGSASALFNVVAHEWTHHYLYFFPLGLHYSDSNETRIINETTASLLGEEVSRKMIQRFYKDYPDILSQVPASSGPAEAPAPATQPGDPDQRSAWDYGTALNETRITVDYYLHYGMVDQAERYMNAQRYVFAAYGYPYHKINQAFFAFYGGYQSPGAGAGGGDPTGPAILEIRQHSASLKAWLETMRSITTRDQLLAVRDSMH